MFVFEFSILWPMSGVLILAKLVVVGVFFMLAYLALGEFGERRDGARLEAMLEAREYPPRDLRAKGHQLYLRTALETDHQDFQRPFRGFHSFERRPAICGLQCQDLVNIATSVVCLHFPLIPLVRFVVSLRTASSSTGEASDPTIVALASCRARHHGTGEMIRYALVSAIPCEAVRHGISPGAIPTKHDSLLRWKPEFLALAGDPDFGSRIDQE